MLEDVVKIVIFLVLFALGGYFFVIFRRRNWFVPGHDTKDGRSELQITQRMGIGGRGFLAVVQCDRQRFLIGVTPSGIFRIGELSGESQETPPGDIDLPK